MPQAIPSRIKSIEPIQLSIPFDDGSTGLGLMPQRWTEFDMVLVRVETEDGVVGWGESFSYFCRSTVVRCIQDMVAPLVVGRTIDDIAALSNELQFKLHLLGRYGIVLFAISGIETALWDIAAKRRGVSLAEHLGGRRRETVPAYASLVRYGDERGVTEFAGRAVAEGYTDVKLHEIALGPIEAGRAAVGPKVRLTTDVNCNWSVAEAERMLPEMKRLDLFWVEEPTFPSDHAPTLQALSRFGVSLASGENASTSIPFEWTVPVLTYPQPSVTKVGGVAEFLKVVDLANTHGKTPMPHSPYFGPGYWATLQLAAHRPEIGMFEFYYVKPAAYVSQSIPLPKAGKVAVPTGPGIGFEPDMAVLAKYRVG
jgi:L-alanine-DL-glutamate epimerase-like enolase superfamily enzyme